MVQKRSKAVAGTPGAGRDPVLTMKNRHVKMYFHGYFSVGGARLHGAHRLELDAVALNRSLRSARCDTCNSEMTALLNSASALVSDRTIMTNPPSGRTSQPRVEIAARAGNDTMTVRARPMSAGVPGPTSATISERVGAVDDPPVATKYSWRPSGDQAGSVVPTSDTVTALPGPGKDRTKTCPFDTYAMRVPSGEGAGYDSRAPEFSQGRSEPSGDRSQIVLVTPPDATT